MIRVRGANDADARSCNGCSGVSLYVVEIAYGSSTISIRVCKDCGRNLIRGLRANIRG